MKIIDILFSNIDDFEKLDKLSIIYDSVKNKQEQIANEEINLIIEKLNSIDNIRLWNSVWNILFCFSYENIILYAQKMVDEFCDTNKMVDSNRKLVSPLQYLFVYKTEINQELMQEFLCCHDIALRFAAIEQLANIDLVSAIQKMDEIYDAADKLYAHDIVDAIELWKESTNKEETYYE